MPLEPTRVSERELITQSGLQLSNPVRVRPSDPPPPSTTLFCFSHLRWSFVYQRPQHLLTRAARQYRVIFVEEPAYEDIKSPRLDLTPTPGGVLVAVPVLPHGTSAVDAEAMQRRLVDRLVDHEQGKRQIFWYYTPMALGFTAHHRPDLCVYDCMDELSAFRFAPPRLTELERKLFDRADLVFTGGRSLYEVKRKLHPSVHACPSSIDAAHFARARGGSAEEPEDQAALPRPRLGFFGVIDERMDLDILLEIASLRPVWQFVMVGPVVKIDPAALPRRDNIHWIGSRRYDELPDYLAGWDVGLMPFAMNESTRFISPTKTPEFLAAGVPVVSTPVVDVVRSYGDAGLVEIASTAGEMVAKAQALLDRPKAAWLDRVDRHLATHSWDKTWLKMHGLMQRKLDASRRRAVPNPAPELQEIAHV